MADQPAATKKAASEDDAPEPTPYEQGEWVEAATDRPPGQVLVFYSVPGQDPEVRLGSTDGRSTATSSPAGPRRRRRRRLQVGDVRRRPRIRG
jgi:hypothetical protein